MEVHGTLFITEKMAQGQRGESRKCVKSCSGDGGAHSALLMEFSY